MMEVLVTMDGGSCLRLTEVLVKIDRGSGLVLMDV